MSIQKRFISLIGLTVSVPSLCFAADSLTQALATNSSLENLQQSYQAIQADSGVHELMRDKSKHSLGFTARLKSHGVETTEYQHYYKGVEVLGSMTFHHSLGGKGRVHNRLRKFDLDVEPTISAESAVSIAKTSVGERELLRAPELKILPSKKGDSARLIYVVELATHGNKFGADVWVDAHSGKLVGEHVHLETLAPVSVRDANHVDPDTIDPDQARDVITNGRVSANADKSAKKALQNANAVLSYYKDVHGRDSFDGQGSAIINIVHVGTQYANAAWVSGMNFMIYGDGDGERMGDLTFATDVAGHELTHGVTSQTAKLTKMDEQGALNEAYSDFFGKMIARDGSWIMGETISMDRKTFPGIRNLRSPNHISETHYDGSGNRVKRAQPASMKEKEQQLDSTTCDNSNDRCWVHFNSTIPGHASFLIYQAIGKAKAEALYYLTLTQYLTSQSSFHDAAEATMQACGALMEQRRLDADDCAAAEDAFYEVGML